LRLRRRQIVDRTAVQLRSARRHARGNGCWVMRRAAMGRLKYGDPRDLAQAGWGVIFAATGPAEAAIKKALRPLLTHRRIQAAAVHDHYYQEYTGQRGYRKGESKVEFLARMGVGPGAADPERMPYYLLIVGDLETIPYRFQYQLDLQYAVGRISFDTVAEYASYARSIVAVETALPEWPRRLALFVPHHRDDPVTDRLVQGLVPLLADSLAQRHPHWNVITAVGSDATKARLASLVSGTEDVALIITAGHGLGFSYGHPLQRARQGAILCQDFTGFSNPGPVALEHYFAADDICDTASVNGLVTFHLGSFSAGTATDRDFPETRGGLLEQGASRPFLSRLSQRLTGHSRGGALAVIGSIEKIWHEPAWPGMGRMSQAFEDAFDRLLSGCRVGYAMEPFSERYAELASDLSEELEIARYEAKVDDLVMSCLWTGRNNSRSYAIVGDPAVRLAVPAES
jgi:hypothetical protein